MTQRALDTQDDFANGQLSRSHATAATRAIRPVHLAAARRRRRSGSNRSFPTGARRSSSTSAIRSSDIRPRAASHRAVAAPRRRAAHASDHARADRTHRHLGDPAAPLVRVDLHRCRSVGSPRLDVPLADVASPRLTTRLPRSATPKPRTMPSEPSSTCSSQRVARATPPAPMVPRLVAFAAKGSETSSVRRLARDAGVSTRYLQMLFRR